eukprot:2336613-Pyramimonas_sp.AAC.1
MQMRKVYAVRRPAQESPPNGPKVRDEWKKINLIEQKRPAAAITNSSAAGRPATYAVAHTAFTKAVILNSMPVAQQAQKIDNTKRTMEDYYEHTKAHQSQTEIYMNEL